LSHYEFQKKGGIARRAGRQQDPLFSRLQNLHQKNAPDIEVRGPHKQARDSHCWCLRHGFAAHGFEGELIAAAIHVNADVGAVQHLSVEDLQG
jgi:hypothetical protein